MASASRRTVPPLWGYDEVLVYYLPVCPDQTFDGTLLPQSRAALRVTLSRDLPRAILGVKFQEVVHAKESWDTWVNEDPKHPTTSNA
jgi:hypothetical protein